MAKFVVVTIASNGVVHAWGDGKVVDDDVEPFSTRARATSAKKKGIAQEKRDAEWGLSDGETKFSVHKVLGWESSQEKL